MADLHQDINNINMDVFHFSKCSIKAPTRWKNSVYVFKEVYTIKE